MHRHGLVKKLIFLSIYTSGELSQDKVVAAICTRSIGPSVLASISSNLESGRKENFYSKTGKRKTSRFSLSADYQKSWQHKYIGFSPSENAIKVAKKRARNFAESNRALIQGQSKLAL
ncbi:MAG: hypothetical protein OQL20_11315 [Sedimenticola sp.]|nr:hypothetical protein [Sedimenticola sp.]